MLHAARIRKLYLYRAGISKAEIARRLKLPRTSVRRVPCHGFFPEVGRPTPYARLPKAHKKVSNDFNLQSLSYPPAARWAYCRRTGGCSFVLRAAAGGGR